MDSAKFMSNQPRRLLMKTSLRSLAEVAQEFHRIRAQKQGRRTHFPKELWQEVFDKSATFSVAEIAEALAISPQYLRKRLNTRPKITIGFAQAQVLNKSLSLVEVTIKQLERPITLRWTGRIKDLPTLIGKLFRGEFS
jgi:hypothetical protein